MTAVFAAHKPRLSVTSVLARSAEITRRGRSPLPPWMTASVVPVTTPSVLWAPTPARPRCTTPLWALWGSKRSQSLASRHQSDTAASWIPHSLQSVPLIHFWSEAVHYKREYSAFWPVQRLLFRARTHHWTQQSNWQCWQGKWPGIIILSSVAIKHHQ